MIIPTIFIALLLLAFIAEDSDAVFFIILGGFVSLTFFGLAYYQGVDRLEFAQNKIGVLQASNLERMEAVLFALSDDIDSEVMFPSDMNPERFVLLGDLNPELGQNPVYFRASQEISDNLDLIEELKLEIPNKRLAIRLLNRMLFIFPYV